jgi:cytochrome c oxidase subunit 1
MLVTNMLWSRTAGEVAGDDPWGAGTLEWSTSSPPPRYNFRYLTAVRGRYPVWQNPPDTPVVVGLSLTDREVLVTTTQDAVPDHRYHMSGDSLWPLALAAASAATLIGFMFHPIAIPIGLVVILIVLAAWFWPSHEPKPIHNPNEISLAKDEPGISG